MYVASRFFVNYTPNVCNLKTSTLTEDVAIMLMKKDEIKCVIKDNGILQKIEEKIGTQEIVSVPRKYVRRCYSLISYYGPKRKENKPYYRRKIGLSTYYNKLN